MIKYVIVGAIFGGCMVFAYDTKSASDYNTEFLPSGLFNETEIVTDPVSGCQYFFYEGGHRMMMSAIWERVNGQMLVRGCKDQVR